MTTLTLAKTAPKIDTTTPDPGSAAPPEFDTTTPVDITLTSYTFRDTPVWGRWMQYRLSREGFWPHLTALSYTGFLGQQMGSNDTFLVRTRRAVILAVKTYETFEPRPVIDVVFLFMHHPDNKDELKDVRQLIRAAEQWGQSAGARMIRVMDPNRVDIPISGVNQILGCKNLTFAAKVFA